MKKQEKKPINDLRKKALKKDLLSFVMGGDDAEIRCAAVGSVYADSIHVATPPPVVIHI
jgi:hypothetical protein